MGSITPRQFALREAILYTDGYLFLSSWIIEPYPELYKKIGIFAEKASSLFSSVAGGSKYAAYYKNVGNLMDTLTMLAEKELNGTPF